MKKTQNLHNTNRAQSVKMAKEIANDTELLDPENGGTMVLRNSSKYLRILYRNTSEHFNPQYVRLFVNRPKAKLITSDRMSPSRIYSESE